MILELLLFVIAMCVHLLAHYFMYTYYGHQPHITFSWKTGITIGRDMYKNIRLDRYFTIVGAGFISGLLIASFNPFVLFAYIVLSCFDILTLSVIMYYHVQGEYAHSHTLQSLLSRLERLEFWDNILEKEHSTFKKIGYDIKRYL